MVTLRNRLQAHLEGWRSNLRPLWREFFAECDGPNILGLSNVCLPDAALRDPFPPLLDLNGPRQDGDPVPERHMSKAFDCIDPNDVRVIVLGQDPYPNPAQATGRAFEDGAWNGRRTQDIASSMKPLLLASLATRQGHQGDFRAGQWPRVRREIERDGLIIPAPSAYFDHLAREGVLFINAAWTFTRTEDFNSHLALWEPVVHYTLSKLVRDSRHMLVFVLFGVPAQRVYVASDAARIAQQVNARVDQVERDHVSRMRLDHNPWLEVNHIFTNATEQEIVWWPPGGA